MWDQIDAPLKIMNNASLGDPLFVLGEIVVPPSVPDVWDPRVDALLITVGALQARVVALEQQTLSAYWHRFVTWVRSLWP